MKKAKWVALVVSGGVLCQFGGCSTVIVDLLVNALLSQLASALLGGTTAV